MSIILFLFLGILGLACIVAMVWVLLSFFLWLNGDIIKYQMEVIRQRNKEENENDG